MNTEGKIDIIALIADALADRLRHSANGAQTFKLVDRDAACQLLSCSPDYFREQIEPHVPVVSMPSAGTRREFRRWDVEDLKTFMASCKRQSGEVRRAS